MTDVERMTAEAAVGATTGARVLSRDGHEGVSHDETLRVFFDSLLKNGPFALGLCDSKLRFITVNEAFAEIGAGRERGDYVGKVPDEIMPALEPKLGGVLRQVMKTGRPLVNVKITGALQRTPGQRRWWLGTFYPIRLRQRISGLGMTMVDISDRKRSRQALAASEERFRLLAENAVDVIYRYRFHPDNRFEYVSPSATAMTGYTPEQYYADPYLGVKITHPDDHAVLQAVMRPVDIGGPHVLRWIRKDGALMWTEHRSRAVCDAAGKVIAVEGIARDVTTRKRAEQERDQAARLQELFVGVLGHDLRNPLSAITTTASVLLEKNGLGHTDAEAVARIVRSGRRMAIMIDQLLDFTRTRSGGGMSVEKRPTNLAEICSHVADELRSSNPGRVIQCRARGGARGKWDPDRLSQVVSNLVGNALRYGDAERPIRLSVSGKPSIVTIEVHNQGAPIPRALRPSLFQPFRRGGRSVGEPAGSASSSKGLGLGLYISHQIVLAHGGTTEVSSTRAEGTTFRVILPR